MGTLDLEHYDSPPKDLVDFKKRLLYQPKTKSATIFLTIKLLSDLFPLKYLKYKHTSGIIPSDIQDLVDISLYLKYESALRMKLSTISALSKILLARARREIRKMRKAEIKKIKAERIDLVGINNYSLQSLADYCLIYQIINPDISLVVNKKDKNVKPENQIKSQCIKPKRSNRSGNEHSLNSDEVNLVLSDLFTCSGDGLNGFELKLYKQVSLKRRRSRQNKDGTLDLRSVNGYRQMRKIYEDIDNLERELV